MKVADRLFASLMFFTRLPWWRLREVPAEAFKHTVDFWPLVGWITGGVMALSFWVLTHFLPLPISMILAFASRLLLTGALHEDGLADFCDGMGGGTTRERTLTIMKDSHIGTYGVIGLIIYFALYYFTTLNLFSVPMICANMLFADVFAKSIASFIITLPYARDEEGAKAHVVYSTRSNEDTIKHFLRIVIAMALPAILMYYLEVPCHILSLFTPIIVFLFLWLWMKKKIGGYTGDCCGATFLICELTFLICQVVR